MMRYTPEEISFVGSIYAADRRIHYRVVSDRFEARFGRPLRQNQVRYIRLRYLWPDGQEHDPLYANRHRGKKKDKARA